MAIYSYVCPDCGWSGDRIVKTDERDSQLCTNTVREDDDGRVLIECQGKLEREEISVTAKMARQWDYLQEDE